MADKQKILFYLDHYIDAFTPKKRHVSRILEKLSDYDCVFHHNQNDFLEELPEAVAVVVWKFRESWYKKSKNLRAIFTPAAGKDWVAPDPETKVKRFFGSFHGRLMAESILGMMLYMSGNFFKYERCKRARDWNPDLFSERQRMQGANILIAGYGTIGRHVADKLRLFNPSIKGLQRHKKSGIDEETGVEYITKERLYEALKSADHVISILPADHETWDFFSYKEFACMKDSAFFYNTGRGMCVSEKDLGGALKTREIAGAALDVFEEEPLDKDSDLWDIENLFISHHSSCIYRDYLDLYLDQVLREIKEILPSE